MKKIILTAAICLVFAGFASAQVIPGFQLGVKAGVNLSSFPQYGNYNNSSQAGYIGGLWARVGALGFIFQPELYVTGKDVNIADNNGNVNRAKFTSVDVPLLFGTKVGAFGLGGRFYTGPVISFAVNKDQSLNQAAGDAVRLNYKDQNYAWQFGAGIDIRKLSIDLRYEAGLNKVAYGPAENSHTRINMFNLTLGYSLFSVL